MTSITGAKSVSVCNQYQLLPDQFLFVAHHALIGCVKDLIRSLRDDDPQRCPVRRRLGQAQILQNVSGLDTLEITSSVNVLLGPVTIANEIFR